jgi:hypothetical protein
MWMIIKAMNTMRSKEKYEYESPMVQIIELVQEGVVCASGRRDNYGNAIEDEWN